MCFIFFKYDANPSYEINRQSQGFSTLLKFRKPVACSLAKRNKAEPEHRENKIIFTSKAKKKRSEIPSNSRRV